MVSELGKKQGMPGEVHGCFIFHIGQITFYIKPDGKQDNMNPGGKVLLTGEMIPDPKP